MKVIDTIKSDKFTISCEMFPPKKELYIDKYKNIACQMAALKPAYLSCTYGATGGTSDYTVDIANTINTCGIPAVAHLTCASSTKMKVASVIKELKDNKVDNILALRGDIPENADFPLPNQYKHAIELIQDLKDYDFCLGGACYPEGHPEAETIDTDIQFLKEKVDAGLDYLTTQMFYDNDIFYNFMFKVLKHGITVPVVPGIMPVTNVNQIKKVLSLSGNMIPPKFIRIVEKFKDSEEALFEAGIAFATEQIIDLAANGVNHVHIYSMNKPKVLKAIFDNLENIYIRN